MKILIIALLLFSGGAAICQQIVQLEYALDADAGAGKNSVINIAPSQDALATFNIDLSGVAVGRHKLFVRTKDSNNKWSLTSIRNIEVLEREGTTTLVQKEYFFDEDPGFGKGNLLNFSTSDSAITTTYTAAVSGLAPGFHKLYERVKDVNGRWSQTYRRNVEVLKTTDTTFIVKAEYFFKNNDSGVGRCVSVVLPPEKDGTFQFSIPLSALPADYASVFVRVQDSINGNWSLTTKADTVVVTPLMLLQFTATRNGKNAQLTWKTNNEINTDKFIVERSTDGFVFNAVGSVKAVNTIANNNYGFTDLLPTSGQRYVYYRLKMMDRDGSYTYSNVQQLKLDIMDADIVVYPNPFTTTLLVKLTDQPRATTLNFVDMQGRMVKKVATRGLQVVLLDVKALSPGTYILEGVTDGKRLFKKVVVKQ